MKWINSSSQHEFNTLTPTIQDRRSSFLRSFKLTFWMGTSDLSIDRHFLELFSHASAPPHVFHESAATAYHYTHELDAQVDKILNLSADENFEDGMEGRTFCSLNLFLSEYPVSGMWHLAARLQSKHMNPGIAADVVRTLGQIDHNQSHDDRVHMAECLLYSPSPLARDAGAVALGDLEDERGIPALQRAISEEPIAALRADMQASLDELIEDSDGVHPKEA